MKMAQEGNKTYLTETNPHSLSGPFLRQDLAPGSVSLLSGRTSRRCARASCLTTRGVNWWPGEDGVVFLDSRSPSEQQSGRCLRGRREVARRFEERSSVYVVQRRLSCRQNASRDVSANSSRPPARRQRAQVTRRRTYHA